MDARVAIEQMDLSRRTRPRRHGAANVRFEGAKTIVELDTDYALVGGRDMADDSIEALGAGRSRALGLHRVSTSPPAAVSRGCDSGSVGKLV